MEKKKIRIDRDCENNTAEIIVLIGDNSRTPPFTTFIPKEIWYSDHVRYAGSICSATKKDIKRALKDIKKTILKMLKDDKQKSASA